MGFLNWTALVVVFAFIATNVYCQETFLDLTIEGDQSIPLGGSTTIACSITNPVQGGFLRWEKSFVNQNKEDDVVFIGTNTNIELPFKNLMTDTGEHRYSAVVEQGDPIVIRLTIKGAQAEDGGHYRCNLPNVQDGLMQSVEITVEVPPSLMQFDATRNGQAFSFQDEQEVEFEEGDELSLSCKADGGYPQPDIAVFIGKNDETSLFESKVAENDPEHLDRGLVKKSFVAEATLKEPIIVSYAHAGKFVTCNSNVPNRDVSLSNSFKIKMQGIPPQITCPDEVVSFTYDNDVNITCTIRADPPLFEIYYYFFMKGSDKETIINEGTNYGDYQLLDEVRDEETGESQVTIFFPKVFANMFRNYTLVAENEIDSMEYTVQLLRDPSREEHASISSRPFLSFLALFASLLFVSNV